ncbi:DUF1080 domain-containing protein [Galbibacter sp. EGI 63066]|uniref:3-keto-disaccharide hydrolase n=1 Tax=Galbibacter sp. EGI 63066 TaxID=2993559 RepID=UPI0022499A85|nr:DUF1080 domain-containing protein [Galbibacter sp. EGI 63066]MCX2678842.1 DUF1080 domain-containing protein [Galbibacter sp. EGI 63066]
MKTITYVFIASLMLLSCKQKSDEKRMEQAEVEETATVETTKKAKESEWKVLFDGSSLDAWHVFNADEGTAGGWTIEEDVLIFTPGDESGDLVTNEDYSNFILSVDWKISEGGNSGIFWGVQEGEEYKTAYQTGPEIQVLDNERHPDAKAGKTHQAGALYDMVAPSKDDAVNPAGEWNTCVIKVDHNTNQGSVTLNGTVVAEFPVHGEEWGKMVENSKFKGWDGFGTSKSGKIGLQDHRNKVYFRNIKIKEIK